MSQEQQQVDPNDPTTFKTGKVVNQQIIKEVPVPALLKTLRSLFPETADDKEDPVTIEIGSIRIPVQSDIRIAFLYEAQEGQVIERPTPVSSRSASSLNQSEVTITSGRRTMLPPKMIPAGTKIPQLPEGVQTIQELLSGTEEIAETVTARNPEK